MSDKIYPSMVIRSQAEAIELLKKENQQLKDNWNELSMWTEMCINELKENDMYDRTSYEQGQIIALESFIAKMQELERNNGK